jgi:hypothetical protein
MNLPTEDLPSQQELTRLTGLKQWEFYAWNLRLAVPEKLRRGLVLSIDSVSCAVRYAPGPELVQGPAERRSTLDPAPKHRVWRRRVSMSKPKKNGKNISLIAEGFGEFCENPFSFELS